MYNITRRRFLLQASLLFLPISCIASAHDIKAADNVLKECRVVFLEWIKQEPLKPEEYLQVSMGDRAFLKDRLSEVTREDFLKKNFFSVNGLQLGKTEAAFLALLGSEAL